jgi:hypothetical protein
MNRKDMVVEEIVSLPFGVITGAVPLTLRALVLLGFSLLALLIQRWVILMMLYGISKTFKPCRTIRMQAEKLADLFSRDCYRPCQVSMAPM